MILLHKKAIFIFVIAISILCGTQSTASQQLALSPLKQVKSQFLYNNARTLSVPAMQKLINEGADVNYAQENKLPILMLTFHDYKKTKCLLENGADVNATHTFGEKYGTVTVLRHALNSEDLPLIKLLLSYKPESNHPSTIIKKNSLTIAQLFIKSGNLTNNEYCACIHESLSDRKIELAALFIKAYKPGQKAIRFLRRLYKVKHKTETISFMQEFNNFSNDELSKLTKDLKNSAITEFLTQNIINENSIESARSAIDFLNILKFEEDKKADRNEILLFMDQLNNLTDDEFSTLITYLNSHKLEKFITAWDPAE